MNTYAAYAMCTLCGYTAGLVGMAIADIGTFPEITNEPYGWMLPLSVFGVVATPALLGFVAGRLWDYRDM